jgi:hypothetical protein
MVLLLNVASVLSFRKSSEGDPEMKKLTILGIVLALVGLGSQVVLAKGYPWRDHAAPFDFLFGNHIDTHQQSQWLDDSLLTGHFYIRFAGELTEDGIPIAKHGDCQMKGDCTVGWVLQGIAMEAELAAHAEGEHPTWKIAAEDLPAQPGYTHFHWLNESPHAGGLTVGQTYPGILLKLTATDTFFFEHHGGFLVTPGIDYDTHANVVPE